MFNILCDSRYLVRKDEVASLLKHLTEHLHPLHTLSADLPMYFFLTQDQSLHHLQGLALIKAALGKNSKLLSPRTETNFVITSKLVIWHGGFDRLHDLYKNTEQLSTVLRNACENIGRAVDLLWIKAFHGNAGLAHALDKNKVKVSPFYTFLNNHVNDDEMVVTDEGRRNLATYLDCPLPLQGDLDLNSSLLSTCADEGERETQHAGASAGASAVGTATLTALQAPGAPAVVTTTTTPVVAAGQSASSTAMVATAQNSTVETGNELLYVTWGEGSHLVKMGQSTSATAVLSRNTTHLGPEVSVYCVHVAKEVIAVFSLNQLESIMLYAAEIILFMTCYYYDQQYNINSAAPKLLRLTVRTCSISALSAAMFTCLSSIFLVNAE